MTKPAPDPVASRALGRATLRGFFYSFGGQGTRLLIAAGQVVVLSRLLPPDVWGVYSMTWAVLALIHLSRDFGLSSAVIQRRDFTQDMANAAFWLSVGVGAVLMLFVAALGKPLAMLFGDPRVMDVTLKFAPIFLLGGVSSHFQAILQRRMQFLRLNIILTISQVVGTGGAILLAWRGYGVDALVFLVVGQEVTTLVLAILFGGWRPGRPRMMGEAGQLLRFGGDVSVFRLLQNAAYALDHVALGIFFNPEVVGLYNRAATLFSTPRRQLNIPFVQVAPTYLARLQDQPVAFGQAAGRLFNAIAYIWYPFLAVLIALPETVLRVVVGEQWVGAAPLLPILALAEFSRLHLGLLNQAEVQLGETKSLRRFGLLTSPVLALTILLGASGGPIMMAAWLAPVMAVIFLGRVLHVSRRSPVSVRVVADSLSGPLFLAAFIAAACWSSRLWLPQPTAFHQLALAVPAILIATGLFLLVSRQGRADAKAMVATLRTFRRPAA